jgi:gluconate 2-dehydrogenase alpha chain
MATEKTDVVIVGMGAAGGVLAAELGKAGMKVIGLERGPRLSTADFRPQDELRFLRRQDLRPKPKRRPVLAGSGETHQPPPIGFAIAGEDGRKRPF